MSAAHTSHPAMTWNKVTEVFDLERSLEPAGKEPAERCNKGCKSCHCKDVELHRFNVQYRPKDRLEEEWHTVILLQEYWVGCAFEASICIGSKVLRVRD